MTYTSQVHKPESETFILTLSDDQWSAIVQEIRAAKLDRLEMRVAWAKRSEPKEARSLPGFTLASGSG
jgi:hypothetical protein